MTTDALSTPIRRILVIEDQPEVQTMLGEMLAQTFPCACCQLAERLELGPRLKLPTPSHQLDRGTFENFLETHARALGMHTILGARVRDVTLSEQAQAHEITYVVAGTDHRVHARWVVDATSRASILKNKLGFRREMEHNVNAVWYRLRGVIDPKALHHRSHHAP